MTYPEILIPDGKEYEFEVLNQLPDLIIKVDEELNILFCNQAANNFFSLPLESDMGVLSRNIFNHEKVISGIALSRINGKYQSEILLENGKNKSKFCAITILCHLNNKTFFTIIIQDLTIRKKVEENLSLKKEELNRFIYRISHDLRGPVASMLGLYNLVNNDIADQVALKYFELYQSQVERLNNIVLSLVKHSAIENLGQTEEFTIEEIIEQIEGGLYMVPKFQRATFKKVITPTKFEGNRIAVFTILHSLIDNAVKFLAPNRPGKIELTALEVNDTLEITICDNGIGIEEEYQPNVFQMFYRGNTMSQGPGLGLYLFRCATEKLNADFSFESTFDQGTSFQVKIPLFYSHLFRK